MLGRWGSSRRAAFGLMNVWKQGTERAHMHLWDRHPFDARQIHVEIGK